MRQLLHEPQTDSSLLYHEPPGDVSDAPLWIQERPQDADPDLSERGTLFDTSDKATLTQSYFPHPTRISASRLKTVSI